MITSTDRTYSRGDRVRCAKTLVASHDGRAMTGPAITGMVTDDDFDALIWVRGDDDGKLHAAYRQDVSP